MAQLEPLMERNFLEYASYVVLDRAIPEIRDGLKPVQRRLLQTLFQMNDGRFHKVANVIGDTMKLHPHGEAAIADALVVLANKEYFIERQGNFGNPLTGHRAAAPRYIECRLTPLALETLFHKHTTEMVPSYDGRREEPVFLRAKLPVLLMLGPEGIAVGMATKILPHNLPELLKAQIALLEGKETRVYPDFASGGLMDVTEYDDGRGKVVLRAKIEKKDDKTIVIRELPYSVTTESLINSIDATAQKGQVKVASVSDFTTSKVEIEINLPRGTYAKDVIPQLYAYTDCEVSISSNVVAVHDGKPREMTITQVLAAQTDRLLENLRAEIQWDLDQWNDKLHWLTLEQIFVEHRVYQRIEKAKTDKAVRKNVWDGMHEHVKLFVRDMVEDDIDRLLRIPIRRISQYDIDKNRKDVKDAEAAIKTCKRKLRQMKKTAIEYLQDIIQRYGKVFPRRTKITTFQVVDKRKVARKDIRMSYDPKSGFFGTKVRGTRFEFTASEFDRILAISKDGSYRVMGAVDKILLPGRVLHCSKFDTEKGATFTIVYRDKKKLVWVKKFKILQFIKDKEYSLVPEGAKIEMLAEGDKPGSVHLEFVPAARQRVTELEVDLNEFAIKGTTARGNRLAPKPVAKVTRVKG